MSFSNILTVIFKLDWWQKKKEIFWHFFWSFFSFCLTKDITGRRWGCHFSGLWKSRSLDAFQKKGDLFYAEWIRNPSTLESIKNNLSSKNSFLSGYTFWATKILIIILAELWIVWKVSENMLSCFLIETVSCKCFHSLVYWLISHFFSSVSLT